MNVAIRLIIFLMMFAVWTGIRAAVAQEVEAARPNIVLCMADDQGWGDVGYYGKSIAKTPVLDEMASVGLRFDRFYAAAPVCSPTRGSVLTGRNPNRFGCFEWGHSLMPQEVTIAEALKQAGYTTGHFGKWHLGNNEFHPSRQGFDEAIVSMGKHFNFNTQPKVDVDPDVYLADFLTDRAVEFIDKHQREPFFLCLHHFAVHSPHEAKKDLIARFQDNAREYRNATVAQGREEAKFLPLLLLGVTEAIGFAHALLLLQAGRIQVGDVVAYIGLLGLFGFPTNISLMAYSRVSLGMAGARRILELMNREYYYPHTADRRTRQDWEKDGSPDMRELARRRARVVLRDHFPPGFPTVVDVQLRQAFAIALPPAVMRPGAYP